MDKPRRLEFNGVGGTFLFHWWLDCTDDILASNDSDRCFPEQPNGWPSVPTAQL